MTCSFQIYRQRIGTYQPSSIRKMTTMHESNYVYSGTSSFIIRLTVTLVFIHYLVIISFLPVILKQESQRQDYSHGMSSLYYYTAPNPPTPLAPAEFSAKSSSQDLLILILTLLLPYSPVTCNARCQHRLSNLEEFKQSPTPP